MDYSKYAQKKETVQSEPIPGREAEMIQNNAGGFAFAIDKWAQLDRFLILGTEGGTYYASEQKYTKENTNTVINCAKDDGRRTVNTIIEFRRNNRAPKMETLLFALAVCAKMSDQNTAMLANRAVSEICGTATHLFTFLKYVKVLGGTGAGTRRAVARWYNDKTPAQIAYQVAKYRNRAGWTHRDVLRVAHIIPATNAHNDVFKYALQTNKENEYNISPEKPHMRIFDAMEMAAKAVSTKELIGIIRQYNLPWECIPTDYLKNPDVNEALLESMSMTATIRQLGRMSSIGLLKPLSQSAKIVIERISNTDELHRARIHPIQILSALATYKEGHGARGSLTWKVNPTIVNTLDTAFYESFNNITPTGKRTYLGLDASYSMGFGNIAGIPGLTPAMGSAAMAMITARTEQVNHYTAAFAEHMKNINITPNDTLNTTMEKISKINWGGTDCALPMIDALGRGLAVDTFVIYTDNETWAGPIHPAQALNEYRHQMNIPAKLVVVGMTATNFSIADPQDNGMLDVVGFDSSAPQIIADFSKS